MSEQEYIDFIAPYGTHVQFLYGDDVIQKVVHLTPYNSNYSHFPHITSDGVKYNMEFEINGKRTSIEECVKLINVYKRPESRNKKLNDLGI